jgi:predicted small secreted protein
MRRPMKRLALIAVLVLSLGLAGCGGGGGGGDDSGGSGNTVDEGITVEEAILVDLFGPVLVSAILVETGDELKICDTVMESQPPQCGEPNLTVVGNALPDFPRGEKVAVRGTVQGNEFLVEAQ